MFKLRSTQVHAMELCGLYLALGATVVTMLEFNMCLLSAYHDCSVQSEVGSSDSFCLTDFLHQGFLRISSKDSPQNAVFSKMSWIT